MVNSITNETLPDLVLEHIGRYRISFMNVMDKVFDGQGDVVGAIRQLKAAKHIKPLGRAEGYGTVLGGFTAYQLSPQGAAHAGFTVKRAKKLNENTLELSFRVLWLCCMSKDRFARLDEHHVTKLFDHPLKSKDCPYCIETSGKRRVYRIRLLGADSADDYALRETRKDLLECAEIPVLKDFVEHGRFGTILVVSKPERRKRLEERIQAQKLKDLGHVRVALVPDLNQIKEVLRD